MKKKKSGVDKNSPEKVKVSTDDKISELEKQISTTKYNKKTQHAIGLMKAKLAKLKEKEAGRGKGKKAPDGWAVKRSGDATVVLLGFPSVGKSTLMNTLTGSKSETASYAFTTLTCIPGMLKYKGAQIQILDVPGIVKGAAAGTGRGKEVLQIIRNADLVLILIDAFHPEHYPVILDEVRDTGVRLNQVKPDVKIVKTEKGGVDVGATIKLTKIDKKTVTVMAREMGLNNATIVIRTDIDADELIDVIEANKVYTKSIVVMNKLDLATEKQIKKVEEQIPIQLKISAQKEKHIDELKELIFKNLRFVRLYLKEIGKKPDMDEPLVMTAPCSIEKVCRKLHKDFADKFKFARVWGKSVKFDGQKILKKKHELEDEDIIELHMR